MKDPNHFFDHALERSGKDVDELKIPIQSIQYVERYQKDQEMTYFTLGVPFIISIFAIVAVASE